MLTTKTKDNQTDQPISLSLQNNEPISNNQQIVQYIVNLSGVETSKKYTKVGFLGRGGFANCYVTQQEGSNRIMATKIIDKAILKSSRTKMRLINEIKIHRTFSHPNIVEFIHYFEDYNNVYIMLELCSNQTLNELLLQRSTLTIPEIQSFLYGICNGLKYLHAKKYIHRDLKLSNIFLNDKYQIKIGDFGLTSQLEFLKQNKRTICGTPNYIAPEVLEGTGYYFQVDIWAIGIIIYHLLFGVPPFEAENSAEIYNKIRNCQLNFPKKGGIPNQAISLIKSILVPQPEKRPSLSEILASSFMKLGTGIPLALPQICYIREPTKQQLESMPLLNMKDTILKQSSKLKSNYTVTETQVKDNTDTQQKYGVSSNLTWDCNGILSTEEQVKWKQILKSTLHTKNTGRVAAPEKALKKVGVLECIIDFQQIDDQAFYFCTGNQVIGTYQKNREICFAHLTDFQQNITQINQIKLYNNLFSEQGQIPFLNYRYRSILNLKAKYLQTKRNKTNNLSRKDSRWDHEFVQLTNHQKLVFVTRINQHKDMIMLRLSNKNIQTIYQHTTDGFLYDFKSGKLYYYDCLSTFTPTQLDITNVRETLQNFLKNSMRSNGAHSIQTCISIVNSNNYIKISIMKLKHIYSLINELQNKVTKFAKNRNSQ